MSDLYKGLAESSLGPMMGQAGAKLLENITVLPDLGSGSPEARRSVAVQWLRRLRRLPRLACELSKHL